LNDVHILHDIFSAID